MILCDLDGVLADFVSGACEVHGRPLYAVTTWDWYAEWGMTDDQFWTPIKAMGYGFYHEFVKPYPWAGELLSIIHMSGPHAIVTANPQHSGLAASKQEWISKWVGRRPIVTVMSDGHDLRAPQLKAMLAGPERILIDDSDDNIEAFRDAGGRAITFPQPWNKLHAMTTHRIDYVRDCLSAIQLGVAV
jgi:hypothetical protein